MTTGTRRAVFLDRDGVLIEAKVRDGKPRPPSHPRDLRLVPGVQIACERLSDAGFLRIVVTNQPDVARGTQTRANVETMNRSLLKEGIVEEVRVCYHDDGDNCSCRKPRPGMLIDAARDHQIDLNRSYMVGDRWRDIEAGRNAGCSTVLVGSGYGERAQIPADLMASSLAEAVELILNHEKE